ncbi:sigma-54-dependent transcriptional regulator [Candidatus Zixiibacteriota bacterium]
MGNKVLVVDDDKNLRFSFRRLLGTDKYEIIEAASGEEALEFLRRAHADLIFLDIKMPGMGGMETLAEIQKITRKIPVIIMTAFGTTDTAINAVKQGAFDFILKPFDVDRVKTLTENALAAHRLMSEPVGWQPEEAAKWEGQMLIGQSKPMQEVYKQIGRVATSDVAVLIEGDSGTGKELVARAIYHHSQRADRPFMAINCAAIPDNLLESELFGFERGAFTSADHRKIGKFEQADGGTLLLDEIGDMSLITQAKILRILQDGTFERVGGTQTLTADVRIIAATNYRLVDLIKQGAFREDLFFRLSVFNIHLAPLSERREDIRPLTEYFISRFNRELNKSIATVPESVFEKLSRYDWPGNVRELENVVKRAVVVSSGDIILPESISFGAAPGPLEPEVIGEPGIEELLEPVFARLAAEHQKDDSLQLIPAMEKLLIKRALKYCGGKQVRAAKLLGIARQTLHNRIAEWGLGDEKDHK